MATHFSGPIISANGIYAGAAGVSGLTTAPLALAVTATANTDFTITGVPLGAIIHSIKVYTTTLFTAGTDAKIQVGITAGGAELVAATSILAVGVVNLAPVASAVAAADWLSAPATITARIVQSGTATAVGAATLLVFFSIP